MIIPFINSIQKTLVYVIKHRSLSTQFSILFGITWTLFACLCALLQHFILASIVTLPHFLYYPYLQMFQNNALLFGSFLSFCYAFGAYVIQNLKPKVNDSLNILNFLAVILQQIALILGMLSIALGRGQGREWGDFSWVPDNMLFLSLLVYILFLGIALLKSQEQKNTLESMIIKLMLIALSLTASSFLIANFTLPYSFVDSVFLFKGIKDLIIQEFYRQALLYFFLILMTLSILFYCIPKHYNIEFYSKKMLLFTLFAVIFLVPCSTFVHLLNESVPPALKTIGVSFSMALSVAIFIGASNANMSFKTALTPFKSDSIGILMRFALFFLFLTATIRFFMSPNWIQDLFNFTQINIRDINLDAYSYGLCAGLASMIIIFQKISKFKIHSHVVFMTVFFVLTGLACIYLSKIFLAPIESYKMSSLLVNTSTQEFKLKFPHWLRDIFFASSIYTGKIKSLYYFLSLKGVIMLGHLLVVCGILLLTVSIYIATLLALGNKVLRIKKI